MDRVDSFRITEVDRAKWEKKCKSLKMEAAKTQSVGPLNRMRELHCPVWYYHLLSLRLVLHHIIYLEAAKYKMPNT